MVLETKLQTGVILPTHPPQKNQKNMCCITGVEVVEFNTSQLGIRLKNRVLLDGFSSEHLCLIHSIFQYFQPFNLS